MSAICPQCHKKPCYVEPTGKQHDYCGRTCAAAAGALKQAAAPAPRQLAGRVEFYHAKLDPKTAFLGNFHECSVAGFPCSEALFQAAKFINPKEPLTSLHNKNIIATFQNIASDGNAGHKAWASGQQCPFSPRADWFTRNVEIMENILRIKYRDNPSLQGLLLKTGVDLLVERTDRDSFWGDGADGKGQNHLGRLHMKLRGELQTTGRLVCPATLEEALLMAAPAANHSQGICDWILSLFCGKPKNS